MAVKEGVDSIADRRRAPVALWIWIGLEVLSFIVAPILRPGPTVFLTTWAFFGALSALLAFGLWRRSRFAWVVALMLALWGLLGGIFVFPAFFSGSDNLGWFIWGFGFSLASLLALVAPGMRAWIREAAVQPELEAAALTGLMGDHRRTD